ncbi:MAG: hypothetical protein ACR2F1_13425 [Nitrososphaeraceae archaeon]
MSSFLGVGGFVSIAFDTQLFTNNQAMLKTYFVQHSTYLRIQPSLHHGLE